MSRIAPRGEHSNDISRGKGPCPAANTCGARSPGFAESALRPRSGPRPTLCARSPSTGPPAPPHGCSMQSLSRPVFRLSDLQTEKARRSFREFVAQGWHVLEPGTPFVDGIHVQAICEHLQAVVE